MNTFNIKMLYCYKFMSQCLPIYAFYTILFIEKGMSVSDIAVLMALWSSFTILFEIPSGILADRWNRRNMLVIAAVLQGACFIIWFFSQTFLMFAAGFVFWAVSGAFTSGTEEGLIYDNLKYDGCEERFAKVYGRARFYANAGTIAGTVSAGLIASFAGTGTAALISAAISILNVFFVLQLREKNYYSERLDETSGGFFETFRESFLFIKESHGALVFILFLVLFVSLGDYLDEFDALIINDLKLSHIWVSVILTVRFVFVAAGDVLAPIVQKKISSVKQIILLEGLACMCLTIFASLWKPSAFLIFGAALMVMAIAEILFIHALQNEIKEEGRATVMSFYGAGQNAAMIGFSLIYAWLSGVFPLQQVYIIISCYGMVGGLTFAALKFNRRF